MRKFRRDPVRWVPAVFLFWGAGSFDKLNANGETHPTVRGEPTEPLAGMKLCRAFRHTGVYPGDYLVYLFPGNEGASKRHTAEGEDRTGQGPD